MELNKVVSIPIDKILPSPYQTRKRFENEAMKELGHSIMYNGLLQPISVRVSPVKEGYYELIAGERRFKVCEAMNYKEIEAIIYDYDDETAKNLTVIENLQREDLNPIEEAEAIKMLVDLYGYTQSEIQESVSKSRSAIANSIRLLELPDIVQQKIRLGKMSASFGRTLLGLKKKNLVEEWAENETILSLPVNTLEKKIKDFNEQDSQSIATKSKPKNTYQEYEKDFQEIFKSRFNSNKVKIKELKNKNIEVKLQLNKEQLILLQELLK